MNATATPLSPQSKNAQINDQDLVNPEIFKEDRWQPLFKQLRDHDPLHWTRKSPWGPFWSVTRYEDIMYVDSHAKLFINEPGITLGDSNDDFRPRAFITMDGDEHRVNRNAVKNAVSPKSLSELEVYLRQFVTEILDDLPVGTAFNWVKEVSVELTCRMLTVLFAVPLEMRYQLVQWSDISTSSDEFFGGNPSGLTEEDRQAKMMECANVFAGIWKEKAEKAAKGEDLGFDFISMLMQSEDTKNIVEDPMRFLGTVIMLIVAGNDTTRNSISGSVLALHENPEELAKVKSNPELIPNMCSEAVRWQSPVIYMRRTAAQDVEMHGKTIKQGDKIVMWYASGNRDERAIQNPDRFIADRPDANKNISFGFGVHRCMGKRLAELQLKILWEEILKRYDRIEVVGEVERAESLFIRGILNLPVVLHPRK